MPEYAKISSPEAFLCQGGFYYNEWLCCGIKQSIAHKKQTAIIAHNKQIAMAGLLQKAMDCPHYQITISILSSVSLNCWQSRILLFAPCVWQIS